MWLSRSSRLELSVTGVELTRPLLANSAEDPPAEGIFLPYLSRVRAGDRAEPRRNAVQLSGLKDVFCGEPGHIQV
ncbi:hypothetical protein SBV1_130104 [Verrucomicrobia bacterium]|nr:hypothetical protein SBV1_130104 [Verrucomicrobiota bacterium]